MKNSTILFSISLLLFFSCRRIEPLNETSTTYYPTELNTYNVYKVTEINHDPFQERSDTQHFFIKEIFFDTLANNSNDLSYRVRLEKSSDDSAYQFLRNLVVENKSLSIQRVENDTRTIKLSFPLKERKSWNANDLNINDFQQARVKNLGLAYSLADTTFNETVIIDLGSDIDPFFATAEEEVYAKHIGLIKRTYKNLETQPEKFIDGTEYEQIFHRTNR